MQDKTPINQYGRRHGYWEVYHYSGTLAYQKNYVNGNLFGYSVEYLNFGKIIQKEYYAR